jgi:hypothetical protein
MTQFGTGWGCEACGTYIGGVPRSRSISITKLGGGGGGGGGHADLRKMTMPPNPLLPEIPTLKVGDTVGFAPVGSLETYVGTIAHIDTDEDNGMVTITLED